MSSPQQPQERRSRTGGATPQDIAELKARQSRSAGKHLPGTEKKDKGGGEGGATPPAQQPEQPEQPGT